MIYHYFETQVSGARVPNKITTKAVFGSCKSISGKENVFMCLVAFQKIFQKIFSGVWKRRRKRQTQKNTDKTQKKNHQRSTLDWVRRRGASRALVRRSTARSHEGEIAIDVARSRTTARSRESLNFQNSYMQRKYIYIYMKNLKSLSCSVYICEM